MQDHVADEGKSEGGESSHDAQMAMEVDENMLCHNLSQLQREGYFQFTSVRSLVFRGEIVSAEILAYLPRLENLSFAPVAVIPETYSPSPYSYSSRSMSGPVGVAATLMNKCPHLTHLALNESSIIASRTCSGWARHLSLLMCSMPGLEHFMTSIQIMATHGSEIVSALLEHHSQRLKSFRVIAPPSIGTHRYSKQRSGSKRRLSDTSFESISEEHNTNYPPSVPSVSTTTRLTKQECLRVLESCPKLETYESRVDLSMQDVIASVPKWPCHDSIKVLALEIQELFNDCSVEEVAIMDMFIKTLLHCSHPSSPTEESKEKQPSISESDTLSPPFSSIPSTSSTDTFMSKPSALDSGYAIPSASSSLSAPKQQPYSTLRQTEPIVANTFTTSPLSETLPSSTYFPSRHHDEASSTRRNNDMETSSDRGDAPKSHVLEQHGPPPLPTTLPDRSRAKYPVQSVGRLVALQYLVEKQLSKLASLDRFSLGQTVYLIPRA
ncbi:hypothetical protein BGZ82_008257 [Podila clonocystis]|nr:hypothetical protein BGZ82_008257 [Podila clonocystis]